MELTQNPKPNIIHRLGNAVDAILGKSSITSIPLTNSSLFNQTFKDWFNQGTNQKYVSWIFDCIDIWGKHFAKVEFKLYDKGSYKQDEIEEVKRHPVLDIFSKPNNFQTWWEIKYRNAQHLCLYGNAYLYKIRDGFGVPRQFIQLRPSNVYARGSSTEYISYYEYHTTTNVVYIKPEDIIHFRYPDPDNEVKGKAVIDNILDVSDVNKLLSSYEKMFYKKGGFLGQVFSTAQDLSPIAFERAKAELQASYGGTDNSFNIALFDNDLQPIKSAYSIKDADISVQKKGNMEEVCAAFNVNKFMMGLSENINRATAQEVSRQFADGVIEPLMDYFDDVLNSQFVHTDFGDNYFIKHVNTSPRDLDGDMAYYNGGIKGGWLTPNEVREYEDLETIDLPYMNEPYDLGKTQVSNTDKNNTDNQTEK